MHHYKYLSAVIMFGICPLSAYAANGVADARGNAMGNTGVTTSDYLLAPFYNPALTAVYRDRDSVGLLVPALGRTSVIRMSRFRPLMICKAPSINLKRQASARRHRRILISLTAILMI